jgi:hypothetical protein
MHEIHLFPEEGRPSRDFIQPPLKLVLGDVFLRDKAVGVIS